MARLSPAFYIHSDCPLLVCAIARSLPAPMVSRDHDRNQLWPRHVNTRCPQNGFIITVHSYLQNTISQSKLAHPYLYLRTPNSRFLFEKSIKSSAIIPHHFGTQTFITDCTTARYLSLFRARLIHSTTSQQNYFRTL